MTNDNSADRPAATYILIDRDGNPWGPFEEATNAVEWAQKKWPDQDHGPKDVGWRVLALRHPNT